MNIVYLEEIDSTNKYAKNNIKFLEDKTVIFTNNQTSGRGRFNRIWDNVGDENLFASIILKPSKEFKEVYSNLTQLLSLCIVYILKDYNVEAKIKWPNDVKINNKKIAGILAETVFESNILEGLILGFGVNLNSKIENLSKVTQAATSLNLEIGQFTDSKIFLKKVLEKFFLLYDSFIEKGFPLIRDEYIQNMLFLNEEILVKNFDSEIKGLLKNINNNGALVLKDNNSQEYIRLIGDILWMKS